MKQQKISSSIKIPKLKYQNHSLRKNIEIKKQQQQQTNTNNKQTTKKNGANSPRWNNIFGQLITALFNSVFQKRVVIGIGRAIKKFKI